MLQRSYIFVPGDSEKKLGKAQDLGADAVVLCLEDAVAEPNKALARTLVGRYLVEHRDTTKPQLWVRVNPLNTEHHLRDLVAIMPGRPTGVFFPKPASGDDFRTLDHFLSALEAQHGLALGSTRIMSVTESSVGTLNQAGFANASPRMSAMCWGAEDMAADLGATTNVDEHGAHFLVHQMNRANCLVVCAAGGMQAVDGICVDLRDEAKLRAECRRAAREGFTGKIAIHPAQIPVINEMFTPSEDAVVHALRVIEAFERSGGAGTVALDGKMLDIPHLKQAKRVLARAGR